MEDDLSLGDVLKKEPKEVLRWIGESFDSSRKENQSFNWLGLAEVAAQNTCSGNGNKHSKPNLDWAKIAFAVYEYLERRSDTTDNWRISLECSEMLLRTNIIISGGYDDNEEALKNVDVVLRWFTQSLNVSFSEVEKRASSLHELGRSEILALRQIKNRLSVIKVLYQNYSLPPEIAPEIEKWLSLREKLP